MKALDRLNLGSGPVAVAGWVNIDRSPSLVLERIAWTKKPLIKLGILGTSHGATWSRDIVRADIRDLPYQNNSITAIYSSHTLEHLYLTDAQQVLRECHRLLAPNGVLRLALPDAEAMAERLLRGCRDGDAEASLAYNRELIAHPFSEPNRLAKLRGLAGGHVHRWQPTAALVSSMLADAGFGHLEAMKYRDGTCPDLDVIETRPDSFFLEAFK